MREDVLHAAKDATYAPVEHMPRCTDADELVNAPFAIDVVEDLEPPFDPPDEGDFDAIDVEDEQIEFTRAAVQRADEPELEVSDMVCDAAISVDPAPEPESAEPTASAAVDEEPPFDAPDESDECFQPPLVEYSLPPLNEDTSAPPEPLLLTRHESTRLDVRAQHSFPRDPRAEEAPLLRPAPAITVLACWDRSETGELIERAAADVRLARTEFYSERGGIDAAIASADECLPDLVLVESTLERTQLLAGLDRLAPRLGASAKIIVIGAVNDISLLRDLAARGVSQYIVPPVGDEDLVQAICTLYANADNARVIAVVGARGGVGASTLAYNLAWSIAERQQVGAALLDLDVAFGVAAFNAADDVRASAAELLADTERLNDIALGSERLRMLTAPASLQASFEPTAEAAAGLVAEVRRTRPVVVLDVPHAWNAWVKQVLTDADEVIVVAGPDLASLRNAEHMLHVLRGARGAGAEPHVILSMTGVPKRPEIPLKDFSDTLATTPIASFVFEPDVFGVAEMARQPLGLSAPRSKAASAIDALATMLTGRDTSARKRQPLKRQMPAPQLSPSLEGPAAPTEAEPAVAPTTVTDLPPIEIAVFESVVEKFESVAPSARPFTFRAEQPALELVHKAPAIEEEALAKARDAAVAEVAQVQAKHIRRGRPGLIRAVACVIALIAAGVLYFQNQREAAAAAPERVIERATPTIAQVTVNAVVAPPTAMTPEQRYEASLRALSVGQLEQGVAALNDAAEAGYAPAQYRLAKLYENGEGVPIDLMLARQWTERAASGGDQRAMHDLGVFYARGEGATRDDAAAFRWFRQAAEYGVLDSQFNLGVFYEEGRGVSADGGEALFWFLVAGRAGDLSAIQRANALEARLSPMQVDQAHARAVAFRTRQAQP